MNECVRLLLKYVKNAIFFGSQFDDDDDDDDDGCHDTLTMGHHHYGHDIKPCTRNATTRCFSEISCRDQIGSL